MSDYYDINTPYSIKYWNTLIKDVNDILQNPPGSGPGCEPVEPIDEVEDPHVWAVKDVEEVRDKLLETCSSLVFREELEIWKPAIIDEIEEQMEDAWCDCETEPVTETFECGSHAYSLLKAGAKEDQCCDQEVLGAVCACGFCHKNTYQGDWNPSVYQHNKDLIDSMQDPYSTASVQTGNYIAAINGMLRYAKDIKKWQSKIDYYTSMMDAQIAYYEANCQGTPPYASDCSQYLNWIHKNGQQARYYQDKLDIAFTRWNERYSISESAETLSNSAAADYWSLGLQLVGRYPEDINLISECFDSLLQNLEWGEWFNPYRDENITDLRPIIYVWTENEAQFGAGVKRNYMRISTSPDGSPYSSTSLGWRYNHRYTLTYYDMKFETRVLPLCEWTTGSGGHDFEPIYYHDDDNWIWSPLPPYDLDDYGTTSVFVKITLPNVAGQDNTDKQDEWYETYLNWYDEHPQYDDRHENY